MAGFVPAIFFPALQRGEDSQGVSDFLCGWGKSAAGGQRSAGKL